MEKEKKDKIIKIGIIFGAVILLVALIILISFLVFVNKKHIETNYYFKNEPNTWIEDKIVINNTEGKIINIKKATRSMGYFDGKKEELYFKENIIPFFPGGYYKGVPFEKGHMDPELYLNLSILYESKATEDELIRKYAKIIIGNEMNPNDGIINGFILGKIENETVVYYIFVDEDWKSNLTFTNILWSSDLKDKSTINIKPFNFDNYEDGIYYDKIENFGNWFFEKRNGGIFVGEINLETLEITDAAKLNSTFIYIH